MTGIENLVVDSSAGFGTVGTTAVKQVNTYTMPTPTADVAGVTQISVGTIASSDPALTVTFNGNTAGFAGVSATASTTATNMAGAINALAGSTVATVGQVEDDAGLAASTAVTSKDLVFTSATSGLVVGMSVSGTGIAAGTTIAAISSDSKTVTLSAAPTATLTTTTGDFTFGGGANSVTVVGAQGAQPTLGFSDATGLTVTNPVSAVNGTEGNTVSFKFGDETGSYLVGATAAATVANFVSALNAVAGSTIAAADNAKVVVTAPTAGTALQAISFTGAAGDTPSVIFTTANVAGVDAAQYDLSGFTGLTSVVSESAGSVNLKLAATTDANITTTSGAVAIAGGKDIAVTHATLNINDMTIAAGANVTLTANKATTGEVNVNGATGVVNVAYNGTFANTADATLGDAVNGAVTVAKGGETITVTQTSGASSATLAATNFTVTQGDVSVTGGTTTNSVTVKQDAAVTAVNGTTSTGKIGVVQGAVTIADGNLATAADTLTTVTIHNFGATTITSTALTTLNVVADATNASGAITIDKSATDTTTAATSLSVVGQGKIGAIDGTQSDVYTSVAFNATAALTVADINFAKATAITASGAGVTTITAHSDDALVTSYTSTGGGLAIGAEIGTGVAFTGGAGKDSVLVGATTKAISMGAGDDTVTMSAALGTGGSIAGGDGNDTLVLNVAASVFGDVAAEPRITGFENLVLGAAADGTYNAAGFTSLRVADADEAVVFSNVAAGVGLTLNKTIGKTVDVVLSDATGLADSINVTFSSAAAINQTTNADLTLAGIETINITTTDTDTTAHTNLLTLVATSATSVVVTGNTGLTFVNTGNVKITSMDASGVQGAAADAAALAVTFTSTNTTVGENVTIKGGSGNNVLTGHANTNDTISGGAGDDTITYTGGADVFSGGAGNDIFDINHFGTKTSFVTITDINSGDKIDLVFLSTSGTIADVTAANWAAAKVTLGAGATLDQYLTAALDGDGSANELVEWFNFDGKTYIAVTSDNVAGFNEGDDSIIVLDGTLDISGSSITNEILTIALV